MASLEEIRTSLAEAREQVRLGYELLRAGQRLLSDAEKLLAELDRLHPESVVPPELRRTDEQTSAALALAASTIELIDGFTGAL